MRHGACPVAAIRANVTPGALTLAAGLGAALLVGAAVRRAGSS